MKTELVRIEKQLRRAVEGDAWHGPALLELLDGVTAEQAASYPLRSAHSIWEIILHLRSDYDLVLRRMAGDGSPLSDADAWPTCPDPTEANWRQSIQEFVLANSRLRQAIRNFPPDRLDVPLVPEVSYTAYTQFIGITQHTAYHAGQIALLKRLS